MTAPSVSIAQLSDLHLVPAGRLYHDLVDSNAMAQAAVTHVQAMTPRPDVVVVSGDITEHGDPLEYEVARRLLGRLDQPVVVVPGNHDEREAFRDAFGGGRSAASSGPLHVVADECGPVRIIGLDVTVPGAHHGDLDPATVAWLESVLESDPERPTMIVMHQPPIRAEPASYVDPPAFLLHHWTPQDGMTTHHIPIGTFRGPLPFA